MCARPEKGARKGGPDRGVGVSGLGALASAVTWLAHFATRSGSLVESVDKDTHFCPVCLLSAVTPETQSSMHERGGAAPSPTLNFLILYCTLSLFVVVRSHLK